MGLTEPTGAATGAPIPSARLLDGLIHAPEGQRAVLMEQFARQHDVMYANIARSLLRQYGLVGRADLEDALQVVRIVAWQLLEEHFAGRKALPAAVGSWAGFVRSACRREMEKFAATHSDRTLSMSNSKQRRLARYGATRARLLGETGHDPSPQEVIDAANAALAGRKSSGSSANMVLTMADSSWDQVRVQQLRPELGDDAADSTASGTPGQDESSAVAEHWDVLPPGDASRFLTRVYDQIRKRHSKEAGRIVSALLLPAIRSVETEEDLERGKTKVPTTIEIAEAEGVPVERVEEVRAVISQTAMRILVSDAKKDPDLRRRLYRFAKHQSVGLVA